MAYLAGIWVQLRKGLLKVTLVNNLQRENSNRNMNVDLYLDVNDL